MYRTPTCRALRDAVVGASRIGRVRALTTAANGDVLVATIDDGPLGGGVGFIHRIGTDGRVTTIAGGGSLEEDGVVAHEARLAAIGLATLQDGSVLFADRRSNRIRRISPDGVITTVAGNREQGFAPDGTPARAAPLRLGYHMVNGLLPVPGRGIVFSEPGNDRLRRVTPDGLIATEAAELVEPAGLAGLPDEGVAIVERDGHRVRRIGSDGTVTTLSSFDRVRNKFLFGPNGAAMLSDGKLVVTVIGGLARLMPDGAAVDATPPQRFTAHDGDFAGRLPRCGGPVTATPDGGALFADMCDQELWFLAPPKATRGLVAVRNVRAGARRLAVTVETTQPGTLELRVKQRGRTVTSMSTAAGEGIQTLHLTTRFSSDWHDVQVIWNGSGRAAASDVVRLFLGGRLPMRFARSEFRKSFALSEVYFGNPAGCRRITVRRVDCQARDLRRRSPRRGECLFVRSFQLMRSGAMFTRNYRCASRDPRPFRSKPRWLHGREPLVDPRLRVALPYY